MPNSTAIDPSANKRKPAAISGRPIAIFRISIVAFLIFLII